MSKRRIKNKIKKRIKKSAINAIENFDIKQVKEHLSAAISNFDGHIRHNAHNYEEYTGAYLRREWRGPKDTLVDYSFWLKNWAIAGLIYSKEPELFNNAFKRYRWTWSLAQSFSAFDHAKEGLRGSALKVANMNFQQLNLGIWGGLYKHLTAKPENTIYLEMTQLGVLASGFDDVGTIAPGGFCAYTTSTVDARGALPYLDAAESYGVPPDVCPLPEAGAGLAVTDDLLTNACCGLGTNMPCDGGIMSSVVMDKRLGIPMYPIYSPLRYKHSEAIEFLVNDFKNAIPFLEEHLGQSFDYQKMKPNLEAMNEQNLAVVDKFDCNRGEYPQYVGMSAWMYKMLTIGANLKQLKENDKKTIEIMRKAIKNKEKIHPQQRFRAIVWGAPCNYYAYFQTWLLNCWGIVTVYSMLGDSGALEAFPLDTEDEMLVCLAENTVRNSMRKQTNGGHENVLDELWNLCDEYSADIVFLQDHIGCKGMGGLLTMFEEQADERGIKLCTVPQDLMDPRSISRMEMRDKVNRFMFNVMNVEPIAPELVNFDDTQGH